MPPTRPTAAPSPDSLLQVRDDEKALLDIAIWLACAIREYQAKNGDVHLEFFVESLDKELVCYYIPPYTLNTNTMCIAGCL
jgi:hypothetical protein